MLATYTVARAGSSEVASGRLVVSNHTVLCLDLTGRNRGFGGVVGPCVLQAQPAQPQQQFCRLQPGLGRSGRRSDWSSGVFRHVSISASLAGNLGPMLHCRIRQFCKGVMHPLQAKLSQTRCAPAARPVERCFTRIWQDQCVATQRRTGDWPAKDHPLIGCRLGPIRAHFRTWGFPPLPILRLNGRPPLLPSREDPFGR